MEVHTVLASLRERDRWQSRLALLEQTLGAIRSRREELRQRLKKAQQELRRLEGSDALRSSDRRSAA